MGLKEQMSGELYFGDEFIGTCSVHIQLPSDVIDLHHIYSGNPKIIDFKGITSLDEIVELKMLLTLVTIKSQNQDDEAVEKREI
jgi:hypothetical protein